MNRLLEGVDLFNELALLLEHGGKFLLDIPLEGEFFLQLNFQLVKLQLEEFLFLDD